jgi:large subunit ribosomal protein L31
MWRREDCEVLIMQTGIHPEYATLEATCSCGNVVKTKSTKPGTLYLDVCSACHPFYTGKQKVLDTGGRIDKFQKRFGGFGKK